MTGTGAPSPNVRKKTLHVRRGTSRRSEQALQARISGSIVGLAEEEIFIGSMNGEGDLRKPVV